MENAEEVVFSTEVAEHTEDLLSTSFPGGEEGSDGGAKMEDTLTIIYLTIGVLGLTGNSLVLVVMAYHRPMRKRMSDIYIGSQSAIDLIVSFFLVLTTVFQDDGRSDLSGFGGELYCRFWVSKQPLWGLLVSSSFNLVALTIERYLAVVHAIWHKIHFNRTKVWISIAIAVVLGYGYSAAYTIPTGAVVEGGACYIFSFYPSPEVQRFNGILIFILQFTVPIAILVFCYTKMALVLRMRVQPGSDASTEKNALNKNMSRARKNVIKTMAMVSVCFVLCWIWNQVYFLMNSVGYEIDFNSTFYHFTVVAVFCNCCVNPFIYMAKLEQFQEGLKKLFCRIERSADSGTTDHTSHTAA